MKTLLVLAISLVLVACGGGEDTVDPQEPTPAPVLTPDPTLENWPPTSPPRPITVI